MAIKPAATPNGHSTPRPVNTGTRLPFNFNPSPRTLRHLHAHARNGEQRDYISHLHLNLTHLLLLPSSLTDSANEDKSRLAIGILTYVLLAPEKLGLMTEGLLRQIFGFGLLALGALAKAVKEVLSPVKEEEVKAGRISVNHIDLRDWVAWQTGLAEEERGVRRGTVQRQLRQLLDLPKDAARRLDLAKSVVELSLGAAFCTETEKDEAGKRKIVLVPEERKGLCWSVEEEWRVERLGYAMQAIEGVGQCLSKRFMYWPVEVGGSVVGGGSEVEGKQEILTEWVAFEDNTT